MTQQEMKKIISNHIISLYLVIVSAFFPFYHAKAETHENFSENNSHLLISPKGVATIHIDQINPQEEILKDTKRKARMQVTNGDFSSYSSDELYDGLIEIEGRGNSTWTMLPKKPYNIDLIDDSGEENLKPLLGMPADAEWCLVANYSDKSLLRIPLAYFLADMIGMEYAPKLRFAEVYLNGKYEGLYCLCEKIKRAKNRIDIKKLNNESPEEHISGGYIVEVTPKERLTSKDSFFVTPHFGSSVFAIKYPKSKNISARQKEWIENYINEVENTIYGDNFDDPETGFRKYLDESSFIDWYLINELAKSNDAAMCASVFFYKDRNELLKTGPVWDFDITFGNISQQFENMHEDGLFVATARWFSRLFEDSLLRKNTRKRYEELYEQVFRQIPLIVDVNAQQLINSGAIDRNFERWQILGEYVWPNYPPYQKTYNGELERLKNWTMARLSWFNVNLFTADEEKCLLLSNEKIPIRPVDPDEFKLGNDSLIRTVRGYDYYVWNDTIVTSSYELKIPKSGEYHVKAIDSNGCESSLSDTILFIPQGMSCPENPTMTCFVYNNRNNLQINFGENTENYTVTLFGITGRTFFNTRTNNRSLSIDTSAMPVGVYLLYIVSDKHKTTYKLIIQ